MVFNFYATIKYYCYSAIFTELQRAKYHSAQKPVSVNASISRITAEFSFKRFLEYEFLSILSSWLYINGN